jgi:hypothetical protein
MSLSYAAKPKWHRSRRFRQSCSAVAIILAISIAAWLGPSAIRRGKIVHTYRNCISFQAPMNDLVFSDDAGDVSGLLNDKRYSVFHLAPWNAVYRTQDPFEHLGALSGWNIWPRLAHTTAFLHKRRSAGGFEALVCVTLVLYVRQPDRILSFDTIVTPPSVLGTLDPRISVGEVLHLEYQEKPLRVFMGHPDPLDESRFTIEFDIGGTRNKMIGILGDDGLVNLFGPKIFGKSAN